MLNGIMLSFEMQSVNKLGFIMLSVIVLCVIVIGVIMLIVLMLRIASYAESNNCTECC
jgi:hypothetical protein